jgi:hypothetical protein
MNTTLTTQPKAVKKLIISKETVRQLTTTEGMNKQFATTLYCSITC